MIGSMTGYGQGSRSSAAWVIDVQTRSVNHRFCEVVVRMPKAYSNLEERVRKLVQEKVARGRLEVFITVLPGEARQKSVRLDKHLAGAYYRSLCELAEHLDLPVPVDLEPLLRLPEVLTISEPEEDMEALWQELAGALGDAVGNLIRMREIEGAALGRDIAHRISRIGEIIQTIDVLAPQVAENYRERLQTRIREYLAEVDPDENRLLTEVAIFAEKSNITEELIRLQSHLQQMQTALAKEKEVGRKLDFILQEVNREINTIGSKATDVAIATAVIEVKSEVEKIREQVQNLE